MMTSIKIAERFFDERRAAARIICAPNQIPAPGQYLLAHDPASDSPLAAPVFCAVRLADGFLAAAPMPSAWTPGTILSARGPLGRGFHLPANARRVLLAVHAGVSPSLLLSLLAPAFAQGASVALTCDSPPEDLPAQVEIQPSSAFADLCGWADYLALAITRESLPGLVENSGVGNPLRAVREAQIFVAAPMPCGGVGECGVCSVVSSRGFKLACEDGPVFELAELF